MAKILLPAIAAGFLFGVATPSNAFWLDAFYQHIEQGREENNLWPQQYVGADRERAQAPFNTMVRNGWRRQNLLGSHHFNEDSTKLTQAGKLRVQWILTQPPQEFRQVFIERSLETGIAETRTATINQFASRVLRDGGIADVTETHIVSDGRPATMVDFVNTTFRENMPIPTLPNSVPGGGGGGEGE